MDQKTGAIQLLEQLRRKNVTVWAADGQLRFKAHAGVLQDSDKAQLKAHKEALLALLSREQSAPAFRSDPDARLEPFPLTDVQQAYLMGRNRLFEYGDVACHIYMQLSYDVLDAARVESVWNRLVECHEMLRAVVYEDGRQQILSQVPHLHVTDYGAESPDALMARLGHTRYTIGRWPFFSIGVSRAAGAIGGAERSILHFSIEFMIADWTSIWMVLTQFEALYFGEQASLQRPALSYRDYVIAEKQMRNGVAYEIDRTYWTDRLDDFPEAPKLPVQRYDETAGAAFERRFLEMPPEQWQRVRAFAAAQAVTPTTLVLMAYAAVLERYSQNKRFALNLTVLNRMPVHPEIHSVVGDFTTINLLEVDFSEGAPFLNVLKTVNRRLFDDLDHGRYSGVEVMREITRRRGRAAAFMPFVFTSAIGLLHSNGSGALKGDLGLGISQTPQVFIDCQVMDGPFGMRVNWDVRQGVFDDGLLADMFDYFGEILRSFAVPAAAPYRLPALPVSEAVQNVRRAAKATLPVHLLHEPIVRMGQAQPGRPALICGGVCLTYGEMLAEARSLYERLIAAGSAPGDRVAVLMPKCRHQVTAVLAILGSAGVYVPIQPEQGALRIQSMLRKVGAKVVITTRDIGFDFDKTMAVICADESASAGQRDATRFASDAGEPALLPCVNRPGDLAYIIFTSGSTGEPKGVAITHEAAVNTIEAVNQQFDVTTSDVVLGVSELSFDLSVYDIFGVLGAGGTLVYPEEVHKREPAHLLSLMRRHGVTLWNSVPALLQMVLLAFENGERAVLPDVRLALLSGDWIPMDLPDRFRCAAPQATVVSLGGATEAAIWSNYHVYRGPVPGFRSIPYGLPLPNQGFRILDSLMQDCPIGVRGELYIVGSGLARGYYNDPERTGAQFFAHPADGEAMYRTGDYGKYHDNGEIEFLGRCDQQVKINGHRIELGEIEAAVEKHPAVVSAAVIHRAGSDDHRLICCYETGLAPESVRAARREEAARLVSDLDRTALEEMTVPDPDCIRAAVATRDTALMAGMLHAVRTHAGADIFTLEQLHQSEGIQPQYHWLVDAWVRLLVRHGCLEQSADGHFQMKSGWDLTSGSDAVGAAWAAADQHWIPEIGGPPMQRYLRAASMQLIEQLSGRINPVDLLYPSGSEETVADMYVHNRMSRYLNACICAFVTRFADQNGPVRILEIGAGTCATSIQVMEALGSRSYHYQVTDVSPFFVTKSQARFEDDPRVDVARLDIDQPIWEQGFSENAFDLIIAVGVLENAVDIGRSLEAVRQLAAPGGYFLFTEPVREEAWILASQGFMMTPPGDILRTDHAIPDFEEWLALLRAADPGSEPVVYPPADSPLRLLELTLFIQPMKTDRQSAEPEAVRRFIEAYLPAYMVPKYYCQMDALPTTVNGKIDRRLLESRTMMERQAASAAVNDELTEAQRAVAEVWSQAGIRGLGLHDNFYERGADSLMMAQVTGQLRSRMASHIPFDTLLRQILNEPTLQQLSDFIETARADDAGDETAGRHIGVATVHPAGKGPLRVVFHAAFGTMNSQRILLERLIEQNRGPVMSIALGDPDRFYRMERQTAVRELSEDYLQLILETGYSRVQLIGYCFGGWLAATVGSRLQESGIEVVDFCMVDCQTVPWQIDDEILLELMFVPNFYISLRQLGFENEDVLERMFFAILGDHGCIPADSLISPAYEAAFGRDQAVIRKMLELSRTERFRHYARMAEAAKGEAIEPEMMLGLFKSFAQTTRVVGGEMDPYVGDVRYFFAKDNNGVFFDREKDLRYWSEQILGNLQISEVNGNHFTCVEVEENAADLAERIGAFEEGRSAR